MCGRCLRIMIRPKVSIEFFLAMVLLVPVSASLLLDSLYHLGYYKKPVFSKNNIPPYHWRINYPLESNYLKSSLPYLDDIQKIKKITEPGSVFYSDVATSYYLAVSSSLYAANPKNNHRKSINRAHATAPQSLLYNLCHGGKYDGKYDSLKSYFKEKNSENIKNGFSQIKYLIYNKDETNKNLMNCSKEQYSDLSAKLGAEFEILFNGEYLDLYQIVD